MRACHRLCGDGQAPCTPDCASPPSNFRDVISPHTPPYPGLLDALVGLTNDEDTSAWCRTLLLRIFEWLRPAETIPRPSLLLARLPPTFFSFSTRPYVVTSSSSLVSLLSVDFLAPPGPLPGSALPFVLTGDTVTLALDPPPFRCAATSTLSTVVLPWCMPCGM